MVASSLEIIFNNLLLDTSNNQSKVKTKDLFSVPRKELKTKSESYTRAIVFQLSGPEGHLKSNWYTLRTAVYF